MVGGWTMRAGWTTALWVGIAVGLVSFDASAQGELLAPGRLEAPVRSELATQIAQAKQAHPDAFTRIRALRGHRPDAYRRFRSQRPNVLPELQALGPGAGAALLDAVVFTPLPRGDATQEEWDAVREGLLLALGDLRLAQASPVLRGIFGSPASDRVALRAAAVGLGKLGGVAERRALLSALARGGPATDAALEGLRYVRRLEVVDAVSPLLHDKSERTARLAARTLGYVGSSWAWKTGNAGRAAQEMPIRTKCAVTLLDAYLRHQGAIREQIARSLAMVDHPATKSMLAERLATTVDEEDRRALTALGDRL